MAVFTPYCGQSCDKKRFSLAAPQGPIGRTGPTFPIAALVASLPVSVSPSARLGAARFKFIPTRLTGTHHGKSAAEVGPSCHKGGLSIPIVQL